MLLVTRTERELKFEWRNDDQHIYVWWYEVTSEFRKTRLQTFLTLHVFTLFYLNPWPSWTKNKWTKKPWQSINWYDVNPSPWESEETICV